MALGLLLTVPVSFGAARRWAHHPLTQLAGSRLGHPGCRPSSILFGLHRPSSCSTTRVPGVAAGWACSPYTRTVLIAFALVALGVGLGVPLVKSYLDNDFVLRSADALENHLAVTGLAAVLCGVQLFVFTLLLHGTVLAMNGRREHDRVGARVLRQYTVVRASQAGFSVAQGVALPFVRREAVESGAHELAFPFDLRALVKPTRNFGVSIAPSRTNTLVDTHNLNGRALVVKS